MSTKKKTPSLIIQNLKAQNIQNACVPKHRQLKVNPLESLFSTRKSLQQRSFGSGNKDPKIQDSTNNVEQLAQDSSKVFEERSSPRKTNAAKTWVIKTYSHTPKPKKTKDDDDRHTVHSVSSTKNEPASARKVIKTGLPSLTETRGSSVQSKNSGFPKRSESLPFKSSAKKQEDFQMPPDDQVPKNRDSVSTNSSLSDKTSNDMDQDSAFEAGAKSSSTQNSVENKESLNDIINEKNNDNQNWRHLIFSPEIDNKELKKHLTAVYSGLIYATKSLRGPPEQMVQNRLVNLATNPDQNESKHHF